MRRCAHAHTHAHTHTHTHMYSCTHTYPHAHRHNTHVCMYTQIHLHLHTHTLVHSYIHRRTCTQTCTHTYTNLFRRAVQQSLVTVQTTLLTCGLNTMKSALRGTLQGARTNSQARMSTAWRATPAGPAKPVAPRPGAGRGVRGSGPCLREPRGRGRCCAEGPSPFLSPLCIPPLFLVYILTRDVTLSLVCWLCGLLYFILVSCFFKSHFWFLLA